MKCLKMVSSNRDYVITGVKIFRGVVVVKRAGIMTPKGDLRPSRGKVEELSRRSLARLAFLATVNSAWLLSMITLTYPVHFPITGEACKRDLHLFLTNLKRRHKGVRYIWFMEFQERGAPHFHILLDQSVPSVSCVRRMAETWCNIVAPDDWEYSRLSDKVTLGLRSACEFVHFRREFWENEKKKDGLAHYAVCYATKLSQKRPPAWFCHTGRFWGSSRDFGFGDGVEFSGNEDTVRELLSTLGRDFSGYSYIPKICFVDIGVTEDLINKFA